MEEYYRRRAAEFEVVYDRADPARRAEIKLLIRAAQESLRGRRVLEVACGTGYWTQFVSRAAREITATDSVEEVLNVARRKTYHCPVTFHLENAYTLSFEAEVFDGGLANFWFSHVPRHRIDRFIEGFHHTLRPQSSVFLADNVLVPDVGGELIRRAGDDNTYRRRTLRDGSEHVIIKNYYSAEELIAIFGKHVPGLSAANVFIGQHFWYITYRLPQA